jgi:hypothetical protein
MKGGGQAKGVLTMDRAGYRQFVGTMEREIQRRMRDQGSYYINRSEVEDVGERAGMARVKAAHVFLLQAGSLWAGELILEQGEPIPVYGPRTSVPAWTAVAFDAEWFRERGKLPESSL